MNEENLPVDSQNDEEWEAPPPPETTSEPEEEKPQMSEIASLANIFIEPGNTFRDMRRKPRFILAGLIIAIAVSAFSIIFLERVGFENFQRHQIESSSRTQQLTKEQKDAIVEQQSSSLVKGITYGAAPIVMIIVFLLGGLIYWLGANAFGGSTRFLHGISVWVYSSLPPTLLFVVANLLVLFLKSVDDIDLTQGQRGLIQANPGMFIDGKEQPVLGALLGSLDLFAIWGYVLAVIGLKVVAKISTGSALAIVLILALAGVTVRVIVALLF